MTVGNQYQTTHQRKRTLSPLWDKQYNFEFVHLTKTQLETMKIQFNVMDKNLLVFDSHLGGYEIDLSTVYFNENHMFNKTWFTLFDFEEKLEGCMGFIKATIEVLGPNDEPTVLEAITDDESIEKTVISPKIRPKGHIIIAEVFRAEHIISSNITTRNLNPYVRVKYGGIFKETKQLKDTSNPDFNQIIFLPAMLPNHSKNVFVELWDDGLFKDSLVGTAIVPFNLFKDSNNMKPFWLNIYGPSPTSTNQYSKIMAINGHKIGSTYRGRILMRFSSRDEANPLGHVLRMDFRIPEITVPNPMTKTYTLKIDVFEGNELPTKQKGILHFCIGPHLIKSSQMEIESGKNSIIWNQSLEDRRITLPMDINQIPDLLIYFCDEDVESHRISYIRLKASDFVVFNNSKREKLMKPMIVKFREEKSHKLLREDQFPGFAVVRVLLLAKNQHEVTKIRKIVPKEYRETYNLYLMLYVGRRLASGEDDGTSNPQVQFFCSGVEVKTLPARRTLNPNYNQILVMPITISKLEHSPPPTLIILVNHIKYVNGQMTNAKSLLGRYWMMLKMDNLKQYINRKSNTTPPEKYDIFYEPPKWLPLIYDKEERVEGKLLLGYCITKANLGFTTGSSLPIPAQKHSFAIHPLGLRDVFGNFKKSWDLIDYDIVIHKSKPLDENGQELDSKELDDQKVEIQRGSNNGDQTITIETWLPNKKELCPVMEVYLYEKSIKANKEDKLIGIAEFKLKNALKYYYGEEEDRTYKQKWERNFYLDRLQAKEEGKKVYLRPKVQKFKPENQLVYLDNFIYDVEFPSEGKAEETHKQYGTAHVVEEDAAKNPQVIMTKGARKQTTPAPQLIESKSSLRNVVTVEKKITIDNKKTVKFKTDIEEEMDNDSSNEMDNFDTEARESLNPQGRESVVQEDNENDILNSHQSVIDAFLGIGKSEDVRREGYVVSQREMATFNRNDLEDLQQEGDILGDSKEISRLEIRSGQEIADLSAELSKDHIGYEDIFVEENKDAKAKQKDNERKKLLDRFRIKNPFMGIFNRRFMNRIEYQDYDTDDEEDFDDVLPYLKGRLEFQTDLERHLFVDEISRTITSIQVFRGNKRDEGGFLRDPQKRSYAVANFKFLCYRIDRKDLVPLQKIKKFMKSIKREREYKVRVYVLRALQLSSIYRNQSPKTYLKFIYNGAEEIDDGSVREGIYPEYYRSKEFESVLMPGTAKLRIEIWERETVKDSLLAYTEIDLEERIFSTKWQEQEKKPVEKRNLINDVYGSRGRLEMWIDIISAKSKEPMTVIYPKIQLPYELRVIVWETKDCVFKDEITKANDLYGRGGVMRGDRFFETDTHWRCRNKGSFNWRWKFDVMLPVDENKNYGEDRFMMQLYDRDLIGGDDLIGETEIDLNMHKMLKKVHYRKKPVDMRMREKGSGLETNMLWFEVFHPEVLDVNGNKISQGKVLMSFQVLPKEMGDKFKNEFGRANPNFYPTLPDPVGRFSFDLLSPFATLKAIIGPDLCYKLIYMACLVFWMVVFVFVGYYLAITIIGVKIANAI